MLRLVPGCLDVERFEGLLRRGRAELARGEPAEAAATLGQALALWRGPALADVSRERFAQPEMARLEGLRLSALCDRVDADLACGGPVELVGELEGLVVEHPLRERLRGQQMLALYRSGRQADALMAYRSAYSALVDGLGIEPSPELRALEAAILRQAVPAPAPSLRPSPLVVDARRLVTCVFAQLADGEPDPESLRAVVERFHATGRAVLASHGGSVVGAAQRRGRRRAGRCRSRTTTMPSARCEPRRSWRGASSRSACAPAPARARWSRPATRRSSARRFAVGRAAGALGRGRRDPACRVDLAGRSPRRPRPRRFAGGGFLLGGLRRRRARRSPVASTVR